MDEWLKEVRRTGGTESGWRDDFPLNRDMPDRLSIDCSALKLPLFPMFWLRMRSFLDWHHAQGRSLSVTPPSDSRTRENFDQMRVLDTSYVELLSDEKPSAQGDVAVLPVTRLMGYGKVEEVAEAAREILEYQYTDAATLGSACYMAVSELCANAIEHGHNGLGAYVAVQHLREPRSRISIAISDMGIGIPEHLRQRYPEWSDDGFAIAKAMEPMVTGTGDPHRGNGSPRLSRPHSSHR